MYQHYLKPKNEGGCLLRSIIAFLRRQGLSLPIKEGVLIALSGGGDSTALAHILVHYGRRIVSRSAIRLLHVNHCARATASDEDEIFVRQLAKKWDLPLTVKSLAFKQPRRGQSWEDWARSERKKIYALEAQRHCCKVWTAHHADDLAETLIWRFFTGALKSHSGGILFEYLCQQRPLLATRKRSLERYLKQEGQPWRTDETNKTGRFLRSQMRQRLMPEIERLFPQAVPILATFALQEQEKFLKIFLQEVEKNENKFKPD